jgi:hypothetical protein
LASAMTSLSAPGHISNVFAAIGQPFHAAIQAFALQVRPPPGL